jgi:drug/metabolite transporter (DMT)-like permease
VKQHQPVYLPIVIIIAILSVSTASLFIRFAQQEAPSLVIAAVRLTFASLLIAPFAIFGHYKEIKSLTRQELFLALLSGFFLALHFASWITSLEYTSVASSVVLVSTGPLWVALLSPFILQEKITKTVFLGLILAVFGGIIIALSDSCIWHSGLVCPPFNTSIQGKSLLGDLLAFLGALAVSGYLIIGRRLRIKISLVPYIFVVYSFSSIILVIFMFIAGQTPFGYSIPTYYWLFILALVPQIIGHSTYNWTLRFLPATLVAVITLGEPIGATILAYFLLSETPSFFKLGGALIILTGIFIAMKSRNTR